MKTSLGAAALVGLCSLGLLAQSPQPRPDAPATSRTASPSGQAATTPSVEGATQTVKQYCVGCHSERGKAGGLSLADFDVARATEHPDTAEKIIRKLRAGMMPPAGARRPDEADAAGSASRARNADGPRGRPRIPIPAGVRSSA